MRLLFSIILAATVLLIGCSPEAYKNSADRQVQDILKDRKEKTLGYVHRLWGHEVVLETSVNGKRTFLTFGDRGFSAKAAK